MARATDAAAWSQLGRAFVTTGVHWPLLALAVGLHPIWRRTAERQVVRASSALLAASVAYLVVVAAVLLSTPSDLAWHLSVTVSRITLPTAELCGAALYVWLYTCERRIDEPWAAARVKRRLPAGGV